jgi:hypothetical protein
MTIPLPYGGISVTVQRATFDRFNDATYVDHHTIDGCLEYPTGSTENNMAVTDSRVLLVPTGSDIVPTDRVKLGPLTYQVQGLPKDWTDPFTGWQPGMQVTLERVS